MGAPWARRLWLNSPTAIRSLNGNCIAKAEVKHAGEAGQAYQEIAALRVQCRSVVNRVDEAYVTTMLGLSLVRSLRNLQPRQVLEPILLGLGQFDI